MFQNWLDKFIENSTEGQQKNIYFKFLTVFSFVMAISIFFKSKFFQ